MQRTWDLSKQHVCELWADVGWKLGVAADLGLTLDKPLEPLFPHLLQGNPQSGPHSIVGREEHCFPWSRSHR